MISPIQAGKTYGVLHTDSFFTFLGFAQKIGSDETQKIDVYLDDKLIDTVEADEFIQKIDDMYDIENKAFRYVLPTQYLGQRSTISFKNHNSQDELLNSPYTLIDKKHEEFNEAVFVHSLEVNFDTEKIEKLNPKDSIGFLATEDNLLNKDFIKLINIFLEKNLNTKFKVFYFNKEQKKLISEKFNKYLSKIDFIIPKNIYDIAINTSIYIHSSTENEKSKDLEYYKTWQVLNQTKANMFMINIFEEIDEKEYSKSLKLVDNCKIEFEKSVVSKIFENDDRYNEFKFINSINQPLSEELKNIYKPNSIGFLATKENLEDEEFLGYIKELVKRFPTINLKGFHFSNINFKKYNLDLKIEFIQIDNIYTILKNIEFYVHNLNNQKNNIMMYIRRNSISIYSYYFINALKNQTLKDGDLIMINSNIDYLKNPEKYNFLENEIYLAKTSPHKLIFNHFMNKAGVVNYLLDLNTNRYEFAHFIVIEYILNNKKFKFHYLQFLNNVSKN